MNTASVTIVERDDGWRDITRHRTYTSAGTALRAVKAFARRRGEGVVVVTWKPATDTGTAAVRALIV